MRIAITTTLGRRTKAAFALRLREPKIRFDLNNAAGYAKSPAAFFIQVKSVNIMESEPE
jgi:hypothetical protein